jgi:hypothetical protein
MEIFYNQLCQIYIFIKYQIIFVIFFHIFHYSKTVLFTFFDNKNTDLELDTFIKSLLSFFYNFSLFVRFSSFQKLLVSPEQFGILDPKITKNMMLNSTLLKIFGIKLKGPKKQNIFLCKHALDLAGSYNC